jgi:hypothetical protein
VNWGSLVWELHERDSTHVYVLPHLSHAKQGLLLLVFFFFFFDDDDDDDGDTDDAAVDADDDHEGPLTVVIFFFCFGGGAFFFSATVDRCLGLRVVVADPEGCKVVVFVVVVLVHEQQVTRRVGHGGLWQAQCPWRSAPPRHKQATNRTNEQRND